jgi:WD40 repeat protein
VFTAGAEGVVREWSVSAFLQNGRPVAEGEFHEDSIWEMAWNKATRVLVTSSADASIKVIKSDANKMAEMHQFITSPDTPTSLAYLNAEKIAVGLTEAKKIGIYEIEKARRVSEVSYQSKEEQSQVNKLLFWGRLKMLVSGHEDRIIRFLDPASGTTGSIQASSSRAWWRTRTP